MSYIRDIIKEELNMDKGERIVLDVSKNTESAPYLGSLYGQDVEPKGTYVIQGKTQLDGWVNGKAVLESPLYIEVDSDYLVQWKRDIAKEYNAKGKMLTDKLMKMGYDGIITKYPSGEFGEIILFPNSSFMLN